MSAYIFSIGLNVGAHEPAYQLTATLRLLLTCGDVHNIALGHGEWQGVPERFIQAEIRASDETWRGLAQAMAEILEQECIAVRPADSHIADWQLVNAAGDVLPGCSVADNPVILLGA